MRAGPSTIAEGRDPPWALPAPAVAAALGCGLGGLSETEAQTRLVRTGPNELPEQPGPGLATLVLRQFSSPLIAILIVAALVALILGQSADAVVIALALVINAAIGLVEELRAERSMAAIRRIVPGRALVVRDGQERTVDPRLLVPGDLLVLREGMRVPADCRVLRSAALAVDEAALTGESEPVDKDARPVAPAAGLAERSPMVLLGSLVTRGHGRVLVTATGSATEIGRLADSMRAIVRVRSPLEERMARFARLVAVAVLAVCAAGLVAGLALGDPLDELGLALVALAVAAIPEGLPIVLTVALAISMQRMARRRVVVRRLAAVETLGSCSAIGSDKTGTLTMNRMVVRAVEAGAVAWEPGGPAPPPIERLLTAVALCNDARAVATEGGYETAGDPTEVALLVAAAEAGLERDALEEERPRLAEVPFASERRTMLTINRVGARVVASLKGAPEAVLERCSEGPDGEALDRVAVRERAEELAAEGMRVIAAAERTLDGHPRPAEAAERAGGFRLLGLLGMIDPPRPEAAAAVAGCRAAGVRVVMLTGDHAGTARAIAEQLGIAEPGARVVTGAELDQMDARALRTAAAEAAVFARVSPQHKLAVVDALRALGHVVAVTGDGVNDAAALRAADIGVAMGAGGTDVAREAADIVLLDDDFASIVAAVEEGRVAFADVRKTAFYLVTTGVAAILAVFAALLGRFDAPLLPAQLIWMNVVTNGIQDVALAFEPAEGDELRERPRRRDEGLISRLLWERAILLGAVMATGTLALFLWQLGAGGDLERARTVALTTMVLFSAFHLGNARSVRRSAFARSPFANRLLLFGTVAALGVHVAAMHIGLTQRVLHLEPLDPPTWAVMVSVASTVVVASELHKRLRRA